MRHKFVAYWIPVFVAFGLAGRATAQEPAEPAPEQPPVAQPAAQPAEQPPAQPAAQPAEQPPAQPAAEKPAAQAFEKAFGEWKNLLVELRDIKVKYADVAEESELAGLRQQFNDKIAQGREMVPGLRKAAIDAYVESPNVDRQLTRFLVKLAADDLRADDYEAAGELTGILMDNECDEKAVVNMAGVAAFALNDFDKADKYLTEAEQLGVLSEAGQSFRSFVAEYKEHWAQEQPIREKEALAEGEEALPRVKIETEVGDVVIELFENQAPQTVGNFIALVEQGWYNDLAFHRVIPGFMAQGGCPKGDGTGGPGYAIYCECDREDYRKHFRGTLSMAKEPAKNTGGSQFFLTFVPTPHLNGRHTAFGRVIEGMDVLKKIKRRDPSAGPTMPEPTKIIKAEVLRKRSHEYLPTKVQ